MREIKQQSRISRKSPAMKTPLVNHVQFDGMTEYVKNILLGQAADILHLDNHTKRYLQEKASITRLLPDEWEPIYLENTPNRLAI